MVYVIYGRESNSENEICLAIVSPVDCLNDTIEVLIKNGCTITDVKTYNSFKFVR